MVASSLGEILGSGDEKPATPPAPVISTEVVAGAGTVAAVIAAIAALQKDSQVARDAAAFLQKQSHLLDIQAKKLEEPHDDKLHRAGVWIRTVLHLVVAVVAVLIGVGVVVIAYRAVTSRAVVIDTFETPPALAASGLSGKVVASGLLDVLTRIQADTRSNAKQRQLSDAWTGDIAIEIPETGVSVGELERILKTRFGRDQHIGGDLVRTDGGGLSLTVRGAGILPKTFPGAAGDLEKLLKQAGEYVYGRSQPGLWAAYLSNHDRNDEAIQFVQDVYAGADPGERPYLLNYWANALVGKGSKGAMSDALSLYQEAVHLKPEFWDGYVNIMHAFYALGDEEDIVKEAELLKNVSRGRPGRAPPDSFENYDSTVWDLPAELAEQIADMASHGGIGTTTGTSGAEAYNVAGTEVLMHDVDSVALRLKTSPIEEKKGPDIAAAELVRAQLAEEQGDLKTAARHWDAFTTAYIDPAVSTNNPSDICLSAVTYEKTGQPAKADAALAAVGTLTFVDCYRSRGDLQDLRGDWAAAQLSYGQAVKLAPSIPSGYYSWGVGLEKHGDLDGAIEKFREAHQRGPHWADPLKAWGDILATRHQWSEALAKYSESIRYAPNWAALKQARDAAARQGKPQ